MKRCPQCGAEYDDYVQYCFVDGAELTDAAVGPPAAAARRATPVPLPPTAPPPRAAAALSPPVQRADKDRALQETNRGLSIWALVFLFMLVITLFGFGGVVGALFLIGGSGPTAQPVDAPRPAPLPPPLPEPPVPAPNANIVQVRFESTPPGAEVWEAGQQVCASTPCDVPHPDYAPAERVFVLKADGYPDLQYRMTDPNQIQQATLVKPGGRKPPPRPKPEDILDSR